MLKNSYKLKNNFLIHDFILKCGAGYLFSTQNNENFYRLLNVDTFGHINEEGVMSLAENGNKVVVVNNDTLWMDVYNIEEDVLLPIFLELS